VGRELAVRARISAADGDILRLEARIEDARGRVLARAAGDWVRVRRDRASAGAPRP
jgi:acyl-CoA thioesterase FadM